MTALELPYERFLRAAHKMVFAVDRGADRALSEAMGGTFSQFLILKSISQCPGLSQQKIAEYLNLTPAAVSRQVDTLAHDGLVERSDDPQSRRSHVISLTKRGEEKLDGMQDLLLASFRKAIDLGPDELEAAATTMEKVCENLYPGEPSKNH